MSPYVRRRSTGVYEIVVSLGRDPLTGKLRQMSRTFRGGAREARREATRLQHEADGGFHKGTIRTVSVLLAEHFDQLAADKRSPTTLREYRRVAAKTITPALGTKAIAKLTVRDLERFYAALVASGLSAGSVRQCHAILSGAFKQAIHWGYLQRSPVDLARPPKIEESEQDTPDTSEVRQILTAALTKETVRGTLLSLAALTGARRGELCGLRWSDIDLTNGVVSIRQTIRHVAGGVVVGGTKTKKSRRLVSLGPDGVRLMAWYRAYFEDAAGVAGTTLAKTAYVFSHSPDGTQPIPPDRVTGFTRDICNALSLPYNFKSLRSYAATTMIAQGIDPKAAAARLGHANTSMTLDVYTRALPANDLQAARILGKALPTLPIGRNMR